LTQRLNPDPELEALVRQLNQGGEAGRQAGADTTAGETGMAPLAWEPPGERSDDEAVGSGRQQAEASPGLDRPLRLMAGEEPLERLLAETIRRQASDLLLVAGGPPSARVDGRLVRLGEVPLDDDSLASLFAPHLGPRHRRALETDGAVDLTLHLAAEGEAAAWRFRVNLHRQRGQLAAALRALPRRVPTLAELELPAALAELVTPSRGLVLVCGPTGAGKSTTLAALVEHLNRTRAAHVITIEDPIEYQHASRQCLIEQVEVGTDSPSFAAALRAALRQDPDVILVGEMRDLETVATALTAAETGHLVLATLHTHDVVQAVHRIVDVFPGEQQPQIRHQLALSLHAVVAQQLVPRRDRRGRVPALEVLIANYAVRNHIRSQQPHRLHNEVTLGKSQGMVSLEESLARLVRAGIVAEDEARIRSSRPDEMDSLLRGRLGGEGG
jgi:twitching motility protein PilT